MTPGALQSAEVALARLLGRPFGARIAIVATDPRQVYPLPFPEEACVVQNALEVRRREFAAGRAAAHGAMRKLGLPVRPVPAAPSRAPVWPAGLVGSLSHCRSVCLAAVARAAELQSLGIDVEEDSPLDENLIPMICSHRERAWLSIQPTDRQGGLAKMIFSAKEAVFKGQFPVTGRMIDFHAIRVLPDLDSGRFEATFREEAGPFRIGDRITGVSTRTGGLILSGVGLMPQMAPV